MDIKILFFFDSRRKDQMGNLEKMLLKEGGILADTDTE